MNPKEFNECIKSLPLKELIDHVIWESIMHATAGCGWTDRARHNLVEYVKESVRWAIDQKHPPTGDDE